MSNKLFRIEIIQPKFDELYKKYEQLNNADKQLLNEEKDSIKNITVATQHRIYRDKWLSIKRILDAIYKKIFPFEIEKKIDENSIILSEKDIELHNQNLGQKIFLDPNSLPPEQQNFFEPTLRHLLEIGAVSYEDYEYMIVTSEPFRNFLKGNILIKNRFIFEEYHKEISEFVNFIQKDGEIRFPEVYNKQKAEIKEGRQEPPATKIEITSMPELQIKGFDEKVILQKPKNKRIQLRKFPKDLKWEEITIRFLNEHEVIIKARNETLQTTYEAMGFQDEKRKLPNKQWEFLKGLSETGGELSWESPRATPRGKKQKQLLAETLKAYFQIDEDPFYSYKQEKSYKIRINLIPEAGSKDKQQDDLEIEKEYKKQTPSVYDEYER